jgi:uncharacterized protein
MLHFYAVKNYLSFKERVEVSFRLTQKASDQGWDEKSPSGQRLATAVAVVGANGAGKTSLIKPAAFVSWFISHSFQSPPTALIPIKPHFATPNEPVEMEVEADDLEGTLWRYVLKATSERVLHEAVYKKSNKKNAKYSHVFVRDWDDKEQQYSIKQDGFGLNPVEAKKVRPNASLISTAAQYGVEVAQHLIGARVATNLMQVGRVRPELGFLNATMLFYNDEQLRKKMETLLRSWDLGLSGVVIRQTDFPIGPDVHLREGAKLPPQYTTLGVHKLKSGGEYELPMVEESSGTRTAFITLSYVLSVLSYGGLAIIDELESDMHPHMIEPILDLFSSSATNPNKAQIIFTSHSVEVMNLLGKSQVFLVEKNDCESESWRLDSMEGVRSQDNFYAKYMSGAYGAVPDL